MLKNAKALICFSAVVFLLLMSPMVTQAASNPYPYSQNIDGDGYNEIPCTWFAWQQAYDTLGIALPSWGNAVNWYQGAINAGYQVGSIPMANSIAVWSGDYYGHVAYVTSGSGNTFTVNEGGRTDIDHNGSQGIAYGYTMTNAVGGSRPGDPNKILLGFIYLKGNPLPDSFYAWITNANTTEFYGYGISVDTAGNVHQNTEWGGSDQIFLFQKQSDGTYMIFDSIDVWNRRALTFLDDVEGWTPIRFTAPNSSSRAQRWRISQDGYGYIFRSEVNTKKVLSPNWGNNIKGDLVAAGTDQGYNWERWNMNMFDVPAAIGSGFSVTINNNIPTVSWSVPSSASNNTKFFSVEIKKNNALVVSERVEYVSGQNNYSWTCPRSLDAGTYTVDVLSRNLFSYTSSAVKTITVKETVHVHTPVPHKGIEATCQQEGSKEYYSCSCGKYFQDNACAQEITEAISVWKVIAVLEHQMETVVDEKATVSANGQMHTECTREGCDYRTDDSIIPKASAIKLSNTTYVYDGKTKKPAVSVKDSSGNAISSSNYTLTYPSGRKNVGKYPVKITFKNYYQGSTSKTFTIKPTKTSLKSLTAKSKSFVVKWSKKTTQVTGYQIQYSTSSSFKSGNKKVTVSSAKTTSKTVKKLKSKKKYYVRIRTYKTVSGTKYYSSWSSKKSVTTKR